MRISWSVRVSLYAVSHPLNLLHRNARLFYFHGGGVTNSPVLFLAFTQPSHFVTIISILFYLDLHSPLWTRNSSTRRTLKRSIKFIGRGYRDNKKLNREGVMSNFWQQYFTTSPGIVACLYTVHKLWHFNDATRIDPRRKWRFRWSPKKRLLVQNNERWKPARTFTSSALIYPTINLARYWNVLKPTNDPVSVVAICLFISTNLRFRDCTQLPHRAIEARNRWCGYVMCCNDTPSTADDHLRTHRCQPVLYAIITIPSVARQLGESLRKILINRLI